LQVETSAVHSKLFGLRAFLDIVALRLGGLAGNTDNPLFIDHLEIDEELFENSCSYALGFRLLKKLNDFSAMRHWTPLGSDWRLWKTSLQLPGAPHTPRGLANLGLTQANDLIIDLCGNSGVPWIDYSPRQDQQSPPAVTQLRNQKPPADKSWLDNYQRITPGRDQPVTRQAPQQTPDSSQDQDDLNSQSAFQFPAQGGTNDILQKSGRPRHWLIYEGFARRVGYPVPRPAITQVGDQTPTEVSCAFQEWSEGDNLGVEVNGAAWVICYALPNSPGTVAPRTNLEA
jgi:hypothetical protein